MTSRSHDFTVTQGSPRVASQWTFLSNHAHVLIFLARNSDADLREVAEAVGVAERTVQMIVTDLEPTGILQRARVGRRNHSTIHFEASLRHPIEKHRTVGDLVAMVGSSPSEGLQTNPA